MIFGASEIRTNDFLPDAKKPHTYNVALIIKCAPFSDHSATILDLENPKFESQRMRYWKFNSSLTTDKNYQDLINKTILLTR